MSFFGKCVTLFIVLSVLMVLLFDIILFADMPLSGNLLFGTFAALLLTIFYGWIDDMFLRKHQPGLEE